MSVVSVDRIDGWAELMASPSIAGWAEEVNPDDKGATLVGSHGGSRITLRFEPMLTTHGIFRKATSLTGVSLRGECQGLAGLDYVLGSYEGKALVSCTDAPHASAWIDPHQGLFDDCVAFGCSVRLRDDAVDCSFDALPDDSAIENAIRVAVAMSGRAKELQSGWQQVADSLGGKLVSISSARSQADRLSEQGEATFAVPATALLNDVSLGNTMVIEVPVRGSRLHVFCGPFKPERWNAPLLYTQLHCSRISDNADRFVVVREGSMRPDVFEWGLQHMPIETLPGYDIRAEDTDVFHDRALRCMRDLCSLGPDAIIGTMGRVSAYYRGARWDQEFLRRACELVEDLAVEIQDHGGAPYR